MKLVVPERIAFGKECLVVYENHKDDGLYLVVYTKKSTFQKTATHNSANSFTEKKTTKQINFGKYVTIIIEFFKNPFISSSYFNR